MRDWDFGLIGFSSIPFKKNCPLLTKLDWCSRELHMHSTFDPPQSYFSEFVTSPFSVPLPLFTNRYFPLVCFVLLCVYIHLAFPFHSLRTNHSWLATPDKMYVTFNIQVSLLLGQPLALRSAKPRVVLLCTTQIFYAYFWLRVKLVRDFCSHICSCFLTYHPAHAHLHTFQVEHSVSV